MKKSIVIFCLLSLILVTCFNPISTVQSIASVSAEGEGNIVVSGSAKINVEPDIAVINVGVESLDMDISVAEQDNSSKISSIMQILLDNNIEENKIRTTNISIEQAYDYSKVTKKFLGYRIINQLEFKTKDIDNLGSVLTALVENGANKLNGIQFTYEDYDSIYLDALGDAIKNAQDKMSVLAGGDTYKISEVRELSNSYIYYPQICSNRMETADFSTIAQGEISIEAKIEVTFTRV